MDTGPALGIRSMVKSTSLLGGNSSISFGNTSTYYSTTGIILIFSTVLFFYVWGTIIKQVAPTSTSFIALWAEINSNPSCFGNTKQRRPQSIIMWLLDSQFIPKITSSPSKGKHTKFTLNPRPVTSIKHPTQTELVATWPEEGVETSNSHPKSRFTKFNLPTHTLEMKECVAPESNNTNTNWPNNKHGSRIRLPDRVAFVEVNAKTLSATLALYAGDATDFFTLKLFFYGQLFTKCPGLSHMKHLWRSPDPPTPPVSWGQFLFRWGSPHW